MFHTLVLLLGQLSVCAYMVLRCVTKLHFSFYDFLSLSLSSPPLFSHCLHMWTKVVLVALLSDTPSQKSKNQVVKGIVLPKMEILSTFMYPCVSPNLFDFILQNTKEDILKNGDYQTILDGH